VTEDTLRRDVRYFDHMSSSYALAVEISLKVCVVGGGYPELGITAERE
jgi:hypothetical protein